MLAFIASEDSGTASDSSNIGSTVASYIGGEIELSPGPVASVQNAAPGANSTGGTTGKATKINK